MKPVAKTSISINRRHFINVYMWKDENEVTRVYRSDGKHLKRGEKVYGCFGSVWGKRRDKVLVGDLHLGLKRMGGGIVAHEIQHVVLRWCQYMGWDFNNERYQEPIAELAERTTKRFWRWYYKNFELVKEMAR